VNLGGFPVHNGDGVKRHSDGSITIQAPAAVAAAQATVPSDQLERPQPVAQVVINVPLSKLSNFLKMMEEWMTDEDWLHKQGGL
jgi:hypothetical protein